MRNVLLLFIALAFITACSKDEFNPLKPKNGQKVELLLDHYWDVNDQQAFLLPDQQKAPLSLHGFDEREPGYIYHVKAKTVVSDLEIMDAPNSWFVFEEVVSKERYAGSETFTISLIANSLFGSALSLTEEDGALMYGSLRLNPINAEVKEQLQGYVDEKEQVRLQVVENKNEKAYSEYLERLRTLELKALVSHDPDNYGKGYLVHSLEVKEL